MDKLGDDIPVKEKDFKVITCDTCGLINETTKTECFNCGKELKMKKVYNKKVISEPIESKKVEKLLDIMVDQKQDKIKCTTCGFEMFDLGVPRGCPKCNRLNG